MLPFFSFACEYPTFYHRTYLLHLSLLFLGGFSDSILRHFSFEKAFSKAAMYGTGCLGHMAFTIGLFLGFLLVYNILSGFTVGLGDWNKE